MPYLKIQTNRELTLEAKRPLLEKFSALLAAQLEKSEKYVMTSLETDIPMTFGGGSEPTAFLEVKSLGLPEEKTAAISAALCEAVEEHLGVAKERVYVEFASPPRHMFGWNGKTFA